MNPKLSGTGEIRALTTDELDLIVGGGIVTDVVTTLEHVAMAGLAVFIGTTKFLTTPH